MLWVLLTLVSACIWGLSNVIDSVVVKKYIRNPKFMAIIVAFLQPIFLIAIFLFYGVDLTISKYLIYPVVSGIVYLTGAVMYYTSIQRDEVSRMVPIMVSSPLLVAILSSIFLNEIFGPLKYIGIMLIVFGSFFISFKKDGRKITLSKGTLLMILTVLIFGSNTVIIKYGLGFMNYITFIFWSEFGLFLTGFVFLTNKEIRKDFINFFKKRERGAVTGILLKEIVDVSGLLIYMAALSIGFASLVSALGSTQALFAILFSLIMTIFYPKLMKEEFTRKTVIIKLISTFLIIIGVWLILI